MDALHEWLSAIRLSVFEETLLSQVYTDILIHQRPEFRQLEPAIVYGGGDREHLPFGWTLNSIRMEGYLQVR